MDGHGEMDTMSSDCHSQCLIKLLLLLVLLLFMYVGLDRMCHVRVADPTFLAGWLVGWLAHRLLHVVSFLCLSFCVATPLLLT